MLHLFHRHILALAEPEEIPLATAVVVSCLATAISLAQEPMAQCANLGASWPWWVRVTNSSELHSKHEKWRACIALPGGRRATVLLGSDAAGMATGSKGLSLIHI